MYDVKQWIMEMEIEAIKKGMRATDFCAKAKVRASTWSGWKNGKVEPKISTMKKIEQAIRGVENASSNI